MKEPESTGNNQRCQPIGDVIELRRIVEESQPPMNQIAKDRC